MLCQSTSRASFCQDGAPTKFIHYDTRWVLGLFMLLPRLLVMSLLVNASWISMHAVISLCRYISRTWMHRRTTQNVVDPKYMRRATGIEDRERFFLIGRNSGMLLLSRVKA
ncbi:hypothetical protein ASPSYDRAFT_391619 [Aspergillus sydowii CBS 593.65]|uniref:Uncharacterized protein n=1 Tax=Aspergillus sydowii CBS 593.65 TaxID=1036612 RepID=A0A1L9T8Z9_9EURO|nr:uncharacterized protein ASPSYDRAFT_391619 [Aspergillus sydowii CBS 593.65]OJJ55907.1 hypothetical protein ASPSYDRAFT_391619 [Aspergillus sydowii CBS 593.65]